MRDDQAVEVLHCGDAEPDLRHRSELVERDRIARASTAQALPGAFVSARDAIEYRDDMRRVGIGFLNRHRKQRPRQSALMDMGTLSEPPQPGGVLVVECDI